MAWSFRLFDVAGTAVRIHFTFFLLLAWIGAAHWMRGGPAEAIDGVLFITILFLCVLLHEFGHVFAARRYGIKTPDVTLLPIGGVASLERMPEKPRQEIVVALAGPAVNLVIALILMLVLGARFDLSQMAQLEQAQSTLTGRVAAANTAAFQLDTGISDGRWPGVAGLCWPCRWAIREQRGLQQASGKPWPWSLP